MKETWKKYLLFLWVSGMILGFSVYYPFLQKIFPILQASPLSGAFSLTQKPAFNLKDWLNTDFQQNFATSLQENPNVRPLMVRLKNETLMKIFGVSPHPKILIGEDGYLFQKSYYETYLGLDFVGEDSLKNVATRLSLVQEKLKAKGIPILLMFPPTKGAHIPEKLSPNYRSIKPQQTNHQFFIQLCKDANIPHIDFSYFRDLEQQTGHRFYPQAGLHWSHYGAVYAADTMITSINRLLNIQMPQISIDSLVRTNELRPPDNELGQLLNLNSPIVYDTATYADYSYKTDSLKKRPRALILGDSYYRLLFDMKIHQNLFTPSSKYWHYFERHISPEHTEGVSFDKYPAYVKSLLDEVDIVLFVCSAQNVHRLGFGFLEAVLGE